MPKFLAFVHPVAFAIVAIAAVGLVCYNIYSSNKQRQKHSYGRGDGPRYPPPPDSPKLPPSPPPSPKRDVRRRKPGKRDESGSDGPEDQRSDTGSKKKVNSDSSEENSKYPLDEQANDTPNQCNLNLDSIRPENEKIFEKHVLNETADSNQSSNIDPENEKKFEKNVLDETDESNRNSSLKVRRKKRSVRKCGCVSSDSSESVRGKKLNIVSASKSDSISSHSKEDQLSEQSDGPNKSSSTSDGCSSPYSVLSEEEAIAYKNKVHDNIQNDTEKVINSEDGIGYSSSSVGSSVRDGVIIVESGICQACDENRVNTRADPCNHQYLCLSCARRIHRVYRRCSICHKKIKQFHII